MTARATPADLREEEQLVQRAAAGDDHAFATIYRAHAPRLHAYLLRRMGTVERAEDLVQEVFLALLRRGEVYRGRAPLRAYLMRVARNRAINAFRDARPEGELPELASHGLAPELRIAVREALGRLPEVFREPILLSNWDQLSYEEIACVLDCPLGTVRSRISRGKRMMARMLRRVKR